MAKVTYASLKLKTNADIETFDFNGNTIELLQYLPIQDKYDLIAMALENSVEEGIYNPIKLDMYFHLYLVYMYTNVTFTDKQREDEMKLYDTLQSNGFIDMVLDRISDSEYNTLTTYLEETLDYLVEYQNTTAFLLKGVIADFTSKFNGIQDMIKDIDEEKFTEVINFAKSLNGGREI